ncbi:MAG: hypothetical protein Q9187_007655 [Circinaria calcarea]
MPVYLAVRGRVFDVTAGRNFYGPGGPYENFAGRDATRGLACGSFDEDMLTKDLEGPLDDLSGLGPDEMSALQDWEERFLEKYLVVGKLVAVESDEAPEDNNLSVAEPVDRDQQRPPVSMEDEKPNKYVPEENPPIPTYYEATSSRPPSSQAFLGASEISHDAERQGLLGRRVPIPQHNGYQPPTVESARSSVDFLSSSSSNSARTSAESLRNEIEQMEVVDPQAEGATRFSKHISNLTHGLSSINLPFRQWLPSFDYLRAHLPKVPQILKPGWIMVGRFLAFLFVVFLAYFVFLSDVFTAGSRGGMGHIYDPESVRLFVQQQVNETFIQENLEHLTLFDHIAGTKGNFVLAKWVEATFNAAKLESAGLERFDVYLNYPTVDGRRVAIIDPPELTWEATIEEEPAYTDPPREQTLVFHGHSRAGNVTGPLIYANYGSREDFKALEDSGVSLKGAIALVRYYGSQGDRALKIKAAELAGAVGCIIYSDPAEDGFRKGKPFPDGRFRPSDSVQRGGVSLMSWVVGDVLSPGFPSLPGENKRLSKDNNPGLNNIPSIPLAWRDAQKLLQALKGHGKKLENDWVGGVPDVEWWSGDQDSPIVHLKNEQDEVEKQPIYNVIGKITGIEQPDKSIIVGNHRDAWCFGAVDPGSGTAVFLEVVRTFGELRKMGWQPLRTIEFASWDGEEYNLIGSTEHVEARIEDLRRDGFAYINVDVAVSGNDFAASASPLFEKALLRVLDRTSDPVANRTLRSIWDEKQKKLGGLGAGSDYVAFQDIAGTSSIDMGFDGPPFPYHSCYDNFQWMSEHGDPGFQYHKLIGQVWALLILELADRPVLPFDLEAYANAIRGYVDDLEKYVVSKGGPPWKNGGMETVFNLRPLYIAADVFTESARLFHEWDHEWTQNIYRSGSFESNAMAIKRMSHNIKMANFETDLLDLKGGLPGREQFKHVIFAPQAWSGYDEAYFPGIRDAIDEGNWSLAQQQVEKVARILTEASVKLNQ